MSKFFFYTLLFILAQIIFFLPAKAASPGDDPSHHNWFELNATPYTGGDNTGDGGTGNPDDLNYYYVGQSFKANIKINVGGTNGSNAANIWIDYDPTQITVSNLKTGNFFSNWAGQDISNGRVKSSAYEIANYAAGLGNFGSIDINLNLNQPTESNYGVASPAMLDINTGAIGATTESNISYNGSDILDSVEDFRFHVWADTRAPYATNPSPSHGMQNVAIDSAYSFELRDSLNGLGDHSGVGTGVDTSAGTIMVDDGGGNNINYKIWSSYHCSGVWGSNLCQVSLNPPSPAGISGDARNWKYNHIYTVQISNFQDLASPNQDQLGDANGPNTMSTQTWQFSTEKDLVAPRLATLVPARGSTNNSIDTNIIIDVVDKKTYPGSISGTGIEPNSCRINVSANGNLIKTYQIGDPELTITSINYGVRFSIDPVSDFGQNEIISVSVYDCVDLASVPNMMTTDTYTFLTVDQDPPYIYSAQPVNDGGVAASGTLSFEIRDDGVGVNLDKTIFYINGDYYTNHGGAGQVTSNGTKITFADSFDFNGNNYAGDTTSVIASSSGYIFFIDPELDFLDQETVPILFYTEDNNQNIMEREVYGVTVNGGLPQICGNGQREGNEVCDDGNFISGDGCAANCLSDETCGNKILDAGEACDDGNTQDGDGCDGVCQKESCPNCPTCPSCANGSSYCGQESSWDSEKNQCIGTKKCYFGTNIVINSTPDIFDLRAEQINESSVLVSFRTSVETKSMVAYGLNKVSHVNLNKETKFGYDHLSDESEYQTTNHSIVVDNLISGRLYFLRPILNKNNMLSAGDEIKITPKFKTIIKENTEELECEPEICNPHIIYLNKDCPPLDCPTQICVDKEKACPETEIQKEIVEIEKVIYKDKLIVSKKIKEIIKEISTQDVVAEKMQDLALEINGRSPKKNNEIIKADRDTEYVKFSGKAKPFENIIIIIY